MPSCIRETFHVYKHIYNIMWLFKVKLESMKTRESSIKQYLPGFILSQNAVLRKHVDLQRNSFMNCTYALKLTNPTSNITVLGD